jgi:hypothetical protein
LNAEVFPFCFYQTEDDMRCGVRKIGLYDDIVPVMREFLKDLKVGGEYLDVSG